MRGSPGIGDSPVRKEDRRFLTGAGRYTDDLREERLASAVLVRSPHAHARIRGMDLDAARAAPGVLEVLTADDVMEAIPNPIPSFTGTAPYDVRNRDGSPMPDASQYPLARDKVRYVGEPVVMVVADTTAQARDAAERVAIDYEPLGAVIDPAEALSPDAPRVWDETGGNRSLDWEAGDGAAVAAAFGRAARVVTCELTSERVAVAFMEPRSAIGDYDRASGRYLLRTGCQGAHGLRGVLSGMLGVEPARLRVVVPDTGGGFGARGGVYPEFPLVLAAARRLGRPVKWTAERTESFLTDHQSRDHRFSARLALDADHHFTALALEVVWRHGAYLASRTPWVMVRYLPPTLGGVYRIPVMHVRLTGVFTSTTPVAAYRGIGRMEATYVVESLVDAAARELGMSPIELRRRNLVGPGALPWRAAGGAVYRSGDFPRNLERALELADAAGFPARREAALARGRRRGLGVAMYVENDGASPSEHAELHANADGTVTLCVGTQDFGMGHATMYSQVLSDALGVRFDDVDVVYGDTDRIAAGFGSAGSRSARIGGGAVVRGAEALVENARPLAAELLEAAAPDVEFAVGDDGGAYRVIGTDRGIGFTEVARAAAGRGEPLRGEARFDTVDESHSNGCHVCEVEVDPDTGRVEVVGHVAFSDVGRAVNPRIVAGQLHGGAAQGIGQALLERVAWDRASGQMLSASFMDYALPRADDLPAFTTGLNELPEDDNPLGVKGVGEGAATGAPSALVNAVRDALGTTDVEMPLTPERVWRCLWR